jgi:hypothetical protein
MLKFNAFNTILLTVENFLGYRFGNIKLPTGGLDIAFVIKSLSFWFLCSNSETTVITACCEPVHDLELFLCVVRDVTVDSELMLLWLFIILLYVQEFFF